MPSRAKTSPPPLEKNIQRGIVQYLKAKGWSVWVTSQGYRSAPGGTRMTPGLPDLYALHPKQGAIWIEVKRPGGKLRPGQQQFIDLHEVATVNLTEPPPVCVLRSLDEARVLFP